MAVGLLYGSPMHPLTRNWYATGDALAQWISREIPSFVGEVPFRYGQALLRELDKHNVQYAIAKDAFLKLAQRGFRFEAAEAVLAPLRIRKDMIAARPSLKGVTKGEAERIRRFTFEEYERRYVLAIRTNDAASAEIILTAVLSLLWGLAKGYAEHKKAQGAQKQVEEEEDLKRAIDRDMDRARTLQTHVKQMSREEMKELSRAATPPIVDNVSRRIAERVTTTNVPPSRRGRGRK